MRLCRFCFGLAIYINIYITHVKILIYFTPENHFLSIGFFIFLDRFTTELDRYTAQTGRYTGPDRLYYAI
jgi:hypothetical protein